MVQRKRKSVRTGHIDIQIKKKDRSQSPLIYRPGFAKANTAKKNPTKNMKETLDGSLNATTIVNSLVAANQEKLKSYK